MKHTHFLRVSWKNVNNGLPLFVLSFFLLTYDWNFTDTHNFTLKHRRESFALFIIALLCSKYQPPPPPLRLCALKLLPNEFTGGSLSDNPHNPDTLRGKRNLSLYVALKFCCHMSQSSCILVCVAEHSEICEALYLSNKKDTRILDLFL